MTLMFPSYEFLKSIKEEKDFTLFDVYGTIYGRLRVNEDGQPGFWFDLMMNGYSGETKWSRYFHKNKKGYESLCIHTQYCFNEILHNLTNQNHDWQNEQRDFELRQAINNTTFNATWTKKNR